MIQARVPRDESFPRSSGWCLASPGWLAYTLREVCTPPRTQEAPVMAQRKTTRKARGVRQPEELPSGRWRGWTWNAVTQRKGPSKTFTTWTEADAWMRDEQAKLDGTYTEAGVPVRRNRRRWLIGDYAMARTRENGAPFSRIPASGHNCRKSGLDG